MTEGSPCIRKCHKSMDTNTILLMMTMVKMMMKMVVEAVDHARGKAAVDQVELRHKLTPTTDCKYQRNYQTAYMRMMTMEVGRSTF